MSNGGQSRRIFRRIYMLWHHCKLSLMIVLSILVVTVVAIVGYADGKYEFNWSYEHPVFASVILDEKVTPEDTLADNDVDTDIDEHSGKDDISGKKNADDTKETVSEDASSDSDVDTSSDASAEPAVSHETRFEPVKKTKVKSPYYSDPGVVALTTDYEYEDVDDSYFEDALFIGDSRVVGLQTYSGLKDIATFYAEEGLTVYSMLDNKIATIPGKKKAVTIEKALKSTSFAKIYIMVGINELGTGTTEDYKKEYAKNINRIRELQPNAKIIIMSVMRVTAAKAKGSYINNVNINDKNVAAAGLADGIDVFYMDINSLFVNKKGNIKGEYTWDGVHLKAEYYYMWVDYLKSHGISTQTV